MRLPNPERGFTLLELLVAIAVFAIAATLAYGGLHRILDGQAILLPRMAGSAARLRAVTLLSEDLQNAAPRSVRDALGTPVPALVAGNRGEVLVSLTRRDPALALLGDQPTLARVDWRLREGVLYREVWPVLDAVQSTRPVPQAVLAGVRSLSLSFREARPDAQWQPYWPPEATSPTPLLDRLPRGVSFILALDDGSALRRVLALPGGGP